MLEGAGFGVVGAVEIVEVVDAFGEADVVDGDCDCDGDGEIGSVFGEAGIGVGEGDFEEVGDGDGDGEGDFEEVGDGDGELLVVTLTPLFQINFLLNLIQVYFLPLTVTVLPIFEHEVPGLTCA